MDPKTLAQIEVQKNFVLFGDIRVNSVYKSYPTNPTYNPTTGAVLESVPVDQPLKIIVDEFNQTRTQSPTNKEDDVAILSIDRKALFPFLDLAVVSKTDDILVIDSQDWQVKAISLDPAKALYSLHIRPK